MKPGWYHVSSKYLGQNIVLEPRRPRGPAVQEDRETRRISVCGDVDACLRAITGLKCPDIGFVYRLHGHAHGLDCDTPQRRVPDWETTEEAWLREPNSFRFVTPIRISFNITEDDHPRWEREQNPTIYVCPRCDQQLPSASVSCGCVRQGTAARALAFADWIQTPAHG